MIIDLIIACKVDFAFWNQQISEVNQINRNKKPKYISAQEIQKCTKWNKIPYPFLIKHVNRIVMEGTSRIKQCIYNEFITNDILHWEIVKAFQLKL